MLCYIHIDCASETVIVIPAQKTCHLPVRPTIHLCVDTYPETVVLSNDLRSLMVTEPQIFPSQ